MQRLYISLGVLVLWTTVLTAQSSTAVSQLEGTPLPVNESFYVEADLRIVDAQTGQSGWRDFGSSENRLILNIEQDGTQPIPEGEYRVLVDVKSYRQGNPDVYPDPAPIPVEFVIQATPAGGINPQLPTYIQNAWRMDIEVISVTRDGVELGSDGPRMRLVAEITEASPCDFDRLAQVPANVFTDNDQPTSPAVDASGTLVAVLPLPPEYCAFEYDFEYVFYDASSKVGKAIAGDNPDTYTVDQLFRNNATRLTSSDVTFRLFNLYRDGYVVARYRAVYYDPSTKRRLYTRWSSHDRLLGSNQQVFPGVVKVGHQVEAYNWQATTNFAEEAKQLPSISYMDGTMRARQNLVLQYGEQNSGPKPDQEFAIGQQTIYDAMGRPAVSVLPAPLYPRGNDALHPLRFDADRLAQTQSGQTYGTDQVESEGACAAEPIGADAGAGRFYSPQNDRPVDNAFVPDAEGYPFAVTRYTPDNTGRVSRQGGVGPRLQVGQHDTRYYYGKPNQWELDRLFGVNVGKASHYQKTMIIDPNGQASVSYLDAKGRTVATALAGASPRNLIPITLPVPDFTVAADEDDESGLTLRFTNNSQNADTYRWNFADLSSATEANPSYTFPELGTYVVCLEATGPTGTQTQCQYVPVNVELDLTEDVVQLQAGFNLVSFDVAPPDNRLTTIFADLIRQDKLLYVQGRDEHGGPALFNPRLNESENVLNHWEPGRGYMVGVTEPLEFTVEGVAIEADFQPPLHAGVNLVAYLPEQPTDPATYFGGLLPDLTELSFARTFADGRFYIYRPENANNEPPFELENGRAYEIYLGTALEGDDWLEENGGFDGDPLGTVYGETVYAATQLDRDPLGIGDENNMHPPAPDEPEPDNAPRITVSILNNIQYPDRVESTYRLLVAEPDDYDLCYALEAATYESECCPRVAVDPDDDTDDGIDPGDLPDDTGSNSPNTAGTAAATNVNYRRDCFECYYDVTITVRAVGACDADGAPIEHTATITNQQFSGDDSDCFANDDVDLSNLRLAVGEYAITKTVTVYEPAVAAATAEYMATTLCVSTEDDFVSTYVDNADRTGCEECDCSQADLDGLCQEFCEIPSPCAALTAQLRGDMQPDGQYARYDVTYNNAGRATYSVPNEIAYEYSIFSLARDGTDKRVFQGMNWTAYDPVVIDGIETPIEDLTVGQFVENFEESWLDELVMHHPEYELIKWCTGNIHPDGDADATTSSHLFDTHLRGVTTYAGAVHLTDKALNDQNGIIAAVTHLIDEDPFFDDPATDAINRERIAEDALTQLAQWFPDGNAPYAWPPAAGSNLEYRRDIAWQLVRDLYLGQKGLAVDRRRIDEKGDIGSAALHNLSWKCIPQPLCEEFDCRSNGCTDSKKLKTHYSARVSRLADAEIISAEPSDYSDPTDPDNPFGRQLAFSQERLEIVCESRCEDYAPGWKAQLLACGAFEGEDDEYLVAAIREMKIICAAGCVGGEPWGTSDIPNNVVFDVEPVRRSFEEIIAYYIDRAGGGVTGDCEDGDCHTDIITFPPASSQDFYGGTLTIPAAQAPLWLTLNKAFLTMRMRDLRRECGNICGPFNPNTDYLSSDRTAAIAALNRVTFEEAERTFTTISAFFNEELTNLFPLTEDLIIPAELNPGGRFCYYADQLRPLLDDFVVCNDRSDEENNDLRADHLNAQLGWSRPWADYDAVLYSGAACQLCADPPTGDLTPEQDAPTCEEQVLAQAEVDARYHYGRYLDERRRDFTTDYRAACLAKVSDHLRMRYAPREYHYTLYYYDQAGNLSMTVPPEGVAMLSKASDTVKIKDYRRTLSASRHFEQYLDPNDDDPDLDALNVTAKQYLPAHRLLTHYRYNSFGEVTLSDAPDKYPARTWYDDLGRPTMSRDGRQANAERVSYTLYDELGRPTEVGEVGATASQLPWLAGLARGRGGLLPILRDQRNRYGVTRTFYSAAELLSYPQTARSALSLRNRVAAVTYQEVPPPLDPNDDEDKYYYQYYDYASHYAYDIAGNVKTLVQDYPDLAVYGQRYKTLDYEYDLISGNVHYLRYQRGQADQFTYHYDYDYDKLNRLSEVFTSEIETDHSVSNLWKREAAYTYYDHGPLHRTVLGQAGLQGLDYAYTLQGWIKGVNGSLGDDYRTVAAPDLNMDGYTGGVGGARLQHRDLYRYANQYFHGDYKPVGSGILNPMDNVLPPNYELFNGNIVRHYRATAADDFRTVGLVGEYDQLHRLRYGRQETYGDQQANANDNSLLSALEAPVYDANGNIHSLQRRYTTTAKPQGEVNQLRYSYLEGTNLLTAVTVPSPERTEPWRPFRFMEGEQTYVYDRAGNLATETDATGTRRLHWNAYGKVREVVSDADFGGRTLFGYGPDQQRWAKRHYAFDGRTEKEAEDGYTYTVGDTDKTTYYVRDAQGNTLATYALDRSADAGAGLTWQQQYIYGSSRLGEVRMDRSLDQRILNFGSRRYELTDHLGNVTTVFSEGVRTYSDRETQETYTAPELVSYREYMPFGLGLERGEGSLYEAGSRFAFNGKELDNQGEWGSSTTAYDYGFRIYNPGIARFLSVDPLTRSFPMLTPYQYASNTPIVAIDLDGLESVVVHLLGQKTRSKIDVTTRIQLQRDFDKRMRSMGVDLKLKFVLDDKALSKDNFQQLSGYHENDSYVVISDAETFDELDFKGLGWQDPDISAYITDVGGPKRVEGIAGISASNDFVAAIDVDAATSRSNPTKGYTKTDFLRFVIEHESGHPKFDLHPNSRSDVNGGYVGDFGLAGHVRNTIMARGTLGVRSGYDTYMVQMLQRLHGKVDAWHPPMALDASPLDQIGQSKYLKHGFPSENELYERLISERVNEDAVRIESSN